MLCFGDHTTAKVKHIDTYDYFNHIDTYGNQKTDNTRNRSFNKALEEAKKASDTKTSSSVGLLTQQQATEDQYIALGEDNSIVSQTPETPKTPRFSTNRNSSTPVLNELKNSLLENKMLESLQNDEDKLEMAGLLGSALLAENSCLKEKILRLEASLFSSQSTIEELEQADSQWTEKVMKLEQNLHDSLSQLKKERLHLQELQEMYEENDKKLNLTMNDLNKQIQEQQMCIKTLQNKLLKYETNEPHDLLKSCETQTPKPDFHKENQFPYIHTEIAQLKHSLNQIERQFKMFQEQFNCQHGKEETTSTPATQSTPAPKNAISAKLQNSNKKRQDSKKNHFSVSLQVKKFNNLNVNDEVTSEHHEILNSTSLSLDNINKQNMKLPLKSEVKNKTIRHPPISARPREENESIEDFFNKYHHKVQNSAQENHQETHFTTQRDQDNNWENQSNSDTKTVQQNKNRENQSNSNPKTATQSNFDWEKQPNSNAKTVNTLHLTTTVFKNQNHQPETHDSHFLDLRQTKKSRQKPKTNRKTRIIWNSKTN